MIKTPAALKALERARTGYEADGYLLSLEQRLPSPFEGFAADAVARRGTEMVIIEVRSADIGDGPRGRLSRLAEIITEKPGWRLDIVTYEPEAVLPDPDRGDMIRRVGEARRLAGVSTDAAVMLIWSAIEGALLRLSKDQGVAPERHIPPRTLIHNLAVHGLLSSSQASELDSFAKLRYRIAHGLPSESLSPGRLEWLARFALAAADGQVANAENMIEWFKANYILSDDAAMIHGKEGVDYSQISFSPHSPGDILRSRFDTALDPDIEQAAEELKEASFFWAQNEGLAAHSSSLPPTR